ncbi:regulator of chromosome condensation 1/beta-lactamase-inhibitor protein II [Lenzites betulinus]|nr:regulator of chromosome condensation 1/beta-lactamase-inhibitor protein II [Lenzites betulinus]
MPPKATYRKIDTKANAASDGPTTRGKRQAPEPAPKTAKKARPASEAPKAKPKPNAKRRAPTNAPNGIHPSPEPAQPLNPPPQPLTEEHPGWLLFCWGASDSGQLGMGADVLSSTHTIAKPRRNQHVEKLSADGALGRHPGAGLKAVAAGALHSVFVDENGSVWTCGMNDNAEMGRRTMTVAEGISTVDVDEATGVPFHTPVPIRSLIDEGFRAATVAVGDCIGAVLNEHGELRAWGTYRTSNGDLGFAPGVPKQYTPAALPTMAKLRFSAIAVGDNHLLLLTTTGAVYSAGSSEYMQLGRRVLARHLLRGTLPEPVVLGTRGRKAVAVGAGSGHSLAVDADGGVWAWGLNGHGQTGTGAVGALRGEDRVVAVPHALRGLGDDVLGAGERVVQVAGGAEHSLFLTSAGRVFACGNFQDGQLGVPEDNAALKARYPEGYVPEPVLVPFPDEDDPVAQIACGTHNNLAITRGGALYGWGRDTTGQVGTGKEGVDVRTPTVIVRKEGNSWSAKAAACGAQHSLALLQKKA